MDDLWHKNQRCIYSLRFFLMRWVSIDLSHPLFHLSMSRRNYCPPPLQLNWYWSHLCCLPESDWVLQCCLLQCLVDYTFDSGNLISIHIGRRDWSLVKVPHNCEISADIMWDYIFSTLIHIQFVGLCFRGLHLQFESSFPSNNGE
jgi:hypothetical protein